jgi:hypothetical protein
MHNFLSLWHSVLEYICNIFYCLTLGALKEATTRREGLEIPTLIQKREEYTPLDFMKI